MNDTKRTILAFVISFLILLGWYAFFTPKAEPDAAPAAPAEKTLAAKPAAQPKATAVAEATGALVAAPANVVAEEKATLSNTLVEYSFTNRGARIEQATLLKYMDHPGPDGRPVKLLNTATEGVAYTKFADSALKSTSMYTLADKGSSRLSYVYKTAEGMKVEKIFTLDPDRYDLNLEVKVTNEGKEPVRDRLSVYMVGDFTAEQSRYNFKGPAYSKGGDYKEVDADDAAKGMTEKGQLSWAGFVESYFIRVFIPKDAQNAEMHFEGDNGSKEIVRVGLGAPLDLPPGATLSREYKFYAGPKEKENLLAVSGGLESALYYGWFTIIAKPLIVVLKAVFDFSGNYGVAIIILTALIKLLFWPLSAKSYRSMARMKELQPKIDKLKERYGNDRERLNMEMMQLWKTHKVNPFSGCLPILVQIPVFIALYNILMNSIDIRHAPFVFWLTDLSAPDPFYITPVLMGLTMFLQQKMTPATGMGEGQMKFMLYGMPILFTWMFKDFASGLVLYWLMNNVFSIAQQAIMMRSPARKA